jgi:hypothetical protein
MAPLGEEEIASPPLEDEDLPPALTLGGDASTSSMLNFSASRNILVQNIQWAGMFQFNIFSQ